MVQAEFCGTKILFVIFCHYWQKKWAFTLQQPTVFKRLVKCMISAYLYFRLRVQMDNSWILESIVLFNEIWFQLSRIEESTTQFWMWQLAFDCFEGRWRGLGQLEWAVASFPEAEIWHGWVLAFTCQDSVCIEQRRAVALNEALLHDRLPSAWLRAPQKVSLPSGSREGWWGCFCCMKP